VTRDAQSDAGRRICALRISVLARAKKGKPLRRTQGSVREGGREGGKQGRGRIRADSATTPFSGRAVEAAGDPSQTRACNTCAHVDARVLYARQGAGRRMQRTHGGRAQGQPVTELIRRSLTRWRAAPATDRNSIRLPSRIVISLSLSLSCFLISFLPLAPMLKRSALNPNGKPAVNGHQYGMPILFSNT